MAQKRVTVKKIAEMAGLSSPTVSQILNNRRTLSSPETQERVRRIARELNFRQSYSDRLKRGDRTKTAGILFSAPFSSESEHNKEMGLCLVQRLMTIGHYAYFLACARDPESNLTGLDDLLERGVEKFIFFGAPAGYHELAEKVRRADRRLAILSSEPDSQVYNDSGSGIEQILRRFLAEGRRDFRIVIPGAVGISDRLEALIRIFPDVPLPELLQRHVVDLPKLDQFAEDWEQQSLAQGEAATARLLENGQVPSAIFYNSDLLALGGMRVLARRGVRIGRDCALGCVNDSTAIRNNVFPVSSVRHNVGPTVEALIRHLTEPDLPRTVIPPQVIFRGPSGTSASQ